LNLRGIRVAVMIGSGRGVRIVVMRHWESVSR
jgi:hypothetical protein